MLEHLRIRKTHVLKTQLGGFVAQRLAPERPEPAGDRFGEGTVERQPVPRARPDAEARNTSLLPIVFGS